MIQIDFFLNNLEETLRISKKTAKNRINNPKNSKPGFEVHKFRHVQNLVALRAAVSLKKNAAKYIIYRHMNRFLLKKKLKRIRHL